jgi:hypothetical protein
MVWWGNGAEGWTPVVSLGDQYGPKITPPPEYPRSGICQVLRISCGSAAGKGHHEKHEPSGAAPPRATPQSEGTALEGEVKVKGSEGKARVLKILKNRKHPEHRSMKEWLGRAFDPAAFDVTKTNLWLRQLKWPRVTEAQLRKVILARLDLRE